MFGSFNYVALLHSLLAKFRRLRAGSGALWRPWYDGGRHGDRELARLRCVCVLCEYCTEITSTWQNCPRAVFAIFCANHQQPSSTSSSTPDADSADEGTTLLWTNTLQITIHTNEDFSEAEHRRRI